jgi:hypothetical protein
VTCSCWKRRSDGVAIAVIALLVLLVASPGYAHDAEPPTPRSQEEPAALPINREPLQRTHKVWQGVLVGAGAVTLGTGAWLVYKDSHDVTGMCITSPIGRTTCPYSTATRWQGWAFVALGAQLAAAGIVWRVFEVRAANKTVSLAAGLGNLRVIGTF